MDIQKQVEVFISLPYETQKEKVLEMLESIKDSHEVFDTFYITIKNLQIVPKELLIFVYKKILDIAEALRKGEQVEADKEITKMQQYMIDIKRREEEAREIEGDPEDLLKQI